MSHAHTDAANNTNTYTHGESNGYSDCNTNNHADNNTDLNSYGYYQSQGNAATSADTTPTSESATLTE